MTDMQLIRYRACGPGRWVRELATPTGWQHTFDVRTRNTLAIDLLHRAERVPLSQAIQEEGRRYAGSVMIPWKR